MALKAIVSAKVTEIARCLSRHLGRREGETATPEVHVA